MIIYLMRHGQTTGDIENRYGGTYDDHLTPEGNKQAQQLAVNLANRGIKKLYCSPKTRAYETAQILVESLPIPLEGDQDWQERDAYGKLSGMTRNEALKQYPDQVALLKDVHNTVGGGEPYEPFKLRIVNALNRTFQRAREEGVLGVVTHGGPIRLIFREVLKKGEINTSDCAYVKLENLNGRYTIIEQDGIVFE